MIELYQFPFSHYCEKVRWALDYKGIAYRTVNLLPGSHFKHLAKLAPKSSVPVLRDGAIVMQDPRPLLTIWTGDMRTRLSHRPTLTLPAKRWTGRNIWMNRSA